MSAVLALAARAQARAGCTLAMACRSATPSLRHVAAPCAATVLRRGAWTTAGASRWLHMGMPAASSKGHDVKAFRQRMLGREGKTPYLQPEDGEVEAPPTPQPAKPRGKGKPTVGEVADMVAEIVTVDGLPDAQPWTLVHFKDGVRGVVVDLHRGDRVSVALIDYHRMGRGAHAVCTNERLETITGRAVRGRVLDALGAPIDDLGDLEQPQQKLVRATLKHDLPPVLSRAPAERFLPSGLKAVDAFFPIARGSNVAVVGGRGVGKSQVALDMLITQHRLNAKRAPQDRVHCIYAAVGRSERTVNSIRSLLTSTGAMDSTTIVTAPNTSTAAARYIAPFTAAAIAKSVRDNGGAALIVYDDLAAHNEAGRQLGAHTDGPSEYGTLLQQSAQFTDAAGGGSLTTIALMSVPSPMVGEVDPDDRRREALLDQITSLCDDVIPLSPTGLSHVHAVPLAFSTLAKRSAQPCQPPTMRTYVRRMRNLLRDLSDTIGDANRALDFDIEPEADIDETLELYAKLNVLFAPSRDALEVVADSQSHTMDYLAPKLARLGRDPTDPVGAAGSGSGKAKGPSSFNRDALLREREAAKRAAAVRKLAGVEDGADAQARRFATLNKRASPEQLVATLFAASHGFLDGVPLSKVLEFESRLWGSLATLPAPADWQALVGDGSEAGDAGAAPGVEGDDAGAHGGPVSLLELLLHPATPTPAVPSEVTADTLRSDGSHAVLQEHPVWRAVAAAVQGLVENMAAATRAQSEAVNRRVAEEADADA